MKTKFMAILVAAVAAAGTAAAADLPRGPAPTITRHRPSTTGPVSTPALTSATSGAK